MVSTVRRLRFGDREIEFIVTRSKRRKKTLGIRVARGVVEVAAPVKTSFREIEEILGRREKWILDKLELASRLPGPINLDSGDKIPYLGKILPLAVRVDDTGNPSVHCDGGKIEIRVAPGEAGDERRESVRTCLAAWYGGQVREVLIERVACWLPLMGISEMPRVLVRDQQARWGSCSADGTLRFSWRLGMVDLDLIDSVVVHELAHLEVMNHSPAFWKVVLNAMPDAKERRRRLNEVGRQLPL